MSKSAKKILDTAEQLFNAQSFNAVGVDLIRDRSGCSKTTMYTYYKNKSQLVQAVLVSRDQKFRQGLTGSIANAEGLAAIKRVFDWHVNWFQQDTFKGCLFVRAVGEFDADENGISVHAVAHKLWIKQLIERHCIESQHPEAAEGVYTLLEGLISRSLVEGFNQQTVDAIWQTVQQLLAK